VFSKEDFEKTVVCFSSSAKRLVLGDSNSRLRAFMRAYKTVACERLSACLCSSIARADGVSKNVKRGQVSVLRGFTPIFQSEEVFMKHPD
jgi:hypothetical protein